MRFCILLPAYNAEKDIAKAIKSVVEQTYEDFSLIVVNDGSTDNTKAIIEGFLDDKRIKLLSQSNTGIAGAYKTAFNYLDGDYIMFLDSDDALQKNALSEVKNVIDKSNADIVQFGISYFDENWQHIRDRLFEEREIFNNNDVLTDYFNSINDGHNRPNLSIRAYKKEIVCDFEFPDIVSLGVDEILNLYAMTRCEHIYYMHQSFYLCQERQQSVSRIKPSFEKIGGILLSQAEMEKIIDAACPEFKDLLYVKFLKFHVGYLNIIKQLPDFKERRAVTKARFAVLKASPRVKLGRKLKLGMTALVKFPCLSKFLSKY